MVDAFIDTRRDGTDAFVSIPAIARMYDSDVWKQLDFLPPGLQNLDLRAPQPLVYDGELALLPAVPLYSWHDNAFQEKSLVGGDRHQIGWS